jgi:hypothetical protein
MPDYAELHLEEVASSNADADDLRLFEAALTASFSEVSTHHLYAAISSKHSVVSGE